MRIQHNIAALNSYRQLGTNNSAVSKNLEKLSSGYRINRAGDDAAGLAISEKMRAQITGLETAQKNANDGISLVQTAEGALTEVHSMLNRMVELATQSSNGIYDQDDRDNLQEEVNALRNEINRIADSTNFNGTTLLDGQLKPNDDGVPAEEGAATTFSIDLTGITTTGGTANAADKYKLNIAGQDIEVTDTGTSVDNIDTGKDIAALFDGKKVTIDGVEFTAKNTDGKLTFTTTDKKATASITNSIKANVTVTAGAGSMAISNNTNIAIGDYVEGKEPVEGQDATGGLKLQIGETAEDTITVAIDDMSARADGLNLMGIDIKTADGASDAIQTIKDAINTVSTQRGKLGAIQNRLEHTINNLGVTTENITSAESRIRDTDMADEMMAYTKNNILVQASQAMLAQANTLPQGVLQLLQ